MYDKTRTTITKIGVGWDLYKRWSVSENKFRWMILSGTSSHSAESLFMDPDNPTPDEVTLFLLEYGDETCFEWEISRKHLETSMFRSMID